MEDEEEHTLEAILFIGMFVLMVEWAS